MFGKPNRVSEPADWRAVADTAQEFYRSHPQKDSDGNAVVYVGFREGGVDAAVSAAQAEPSQDKALAVFLKVLEDHKITETDVVRIS